MKSVQTNGLREWFSALFISSFDLFSFLFVVVHHQPFVGNTSTKAACPGPFNGAPRYDVYQTGAAMASYVCSQHPSAGRSASTYSHFFVIFSSPVSCCSCGGTSKREGRAGSPTTIMHDRGGTVPFSNLSRVGTGNWGREIERTRTWWFNKKLSGLS